MKRLIPIILILALVGYFGYRSWEKSQEAKKNDLFYGTVEANEVLLSSQLAGQIMEFYAQEGSQVHDGDLLVVLDDTIYKAQLEQGLATIEATSSQAKVVDAGLAGVNTEVRRTERLLESGSATGMQLDTLRAQRDTLRAQRSAIYSQVDAAKAAVDVIEKQLEYTRIHAPMDGTVLRTHADLGETVFPGSALMVVADMQNMEIDVYVPEPMLGKINTGRQVEVFTDSYPDKPLYGNVSKISDTAEFTPKNVQTKDERVRLIYKIEVEIPNPDGILKIGMPVDVRFLEK